VSNLPVPTRPARSQSLARVAVSPSAAMATAAGVGIGALEQSFVLAVVLGAGAWAARMITAVVTRARRERAARPRPAAVDPWSVPEPWRQLLRQAGDAQSRFDQTVDTWPAGPIRDRLVLLRPRLYANVGEMASLAHHGAALSGWSPGGAPNARARPSRAQLSDGLRQAEAERQRLGPNAPSREASLARAAEALAAQLRAARNSEDASRSVEDHLRTVVARLDEAVTELLVLATGGGSERGPGPMTPTAADTLEGSLDGLRDEISALHQGLQDAQLPPAPPTP
jgi:hypothetical protein